ncbi:MAG: nucleotidyl transferase AbiEii/AbiGii toxin family protein [Candidatus Thermoplasmatota archaeon]
MISENEIRRKARINQVPITTIERDYAQAWLISTLPDMIFKGGTCLRKIYFENYRFSDDLDYTISDNIKNNELKEKIRNSIKKSRTQSGINFLDEFKSKKVQNGYVYIIYFRIIRTSGDPLKIKMDITKKDNEKIITKPTKKLIKHKYSDNLNKKIMVYPLKEIFAEKTRSLFERTRPRDLYDVSFLKDNIAFDKTLFKKKCEFKKLKPRVDELQKRKTDFVDSWENSLKHQLKELPIAEKIFENVIQFLSESI